MAQPPEGPAVQAWSRIPVVGPRALEDALTVFSPLSPDPLQRQSQLLSFVEGLREEGYLPTVLRSRDVYGYTSCTCQVPGAGGPAAAAAADPNPNPPPRPPPPPTPPPPPPPPLSSSSSSSSSGSSARAGGGSKTPRRSPKWNGWLRPPASGVRLGQEKGDSGQRRHRYPERRGPAQRESRRPPPQPQQQQQPPPPEGELSGRGRPPDLGEGAGPLSRSRLQLLRSKVIKVDDSSSDEEVRRKAQKILRVNLSPVIKIRPISYPHH